MQKSFSLQKHGWFLSLENVQIEFYVRIKVFPLKVKPKWWCSTFNDNGYG